MATTSDIQMDSLLREGGEQSPQQTVSTEQTLLDRMARFRQNPFNFAHELYLFIRGVDWRSYEKVIGQPVFYSGYTAKIKNTTMASPLLRNKLEELVEAELVPLDLADELLPLVPLAAGVVAVAGAEPEEAPEALPDAVAGAEPEAEPEPDLFVVFTK